MCFEVNIQKVEANIYQCFCSNCSFFPHLLLSCPQEWLSGMGFVRQSLSASRECGIGLCVLGPLWTPPPATTGRNPCWNLMLCSHIAFYCVYVITHSAMIILVHVTWYTCAWVKFLGCGVCTCLVLLGDAKRYSKMGVKSGGLLPPAVYSDVHYSVSLFHILPILSDFKIFARQVGVNGISLCFHYVFSWLLMNISPYVMDIYLASSMKCLFISFAHGLFVPSWVYLFSYWHRSSLFWGY